MRRFRFLWIVGVAFILFALAPSITGFATDWMWFTEVGFRTVYSTELLTKTLLFVGATLFAYFFILFNGRLAATDTTKTPVLWRVNPELPPIDIGRSVGKAVIPIAAVFALFFGGGASADWMDFLQVTHRSSFGAVDPVFGKEIGYYVFVLPALADLLGTLRSLVVLALVISLFIHLLRGRVTFRPQRVGLESPADKHIAVLLVAFLI